MHTEPRRPARPLTTAFGLTALAASVALLGAPAHAQLVPSRAGAVAAPAAAVAAVATPSCAGGIVYDDGGFEDGVRFTDEETGAGLRDAVMLFDLPADGAAIDQVCLCWRRGENSTSDSLNHSIVFFAADGPGGAPGTQLAVVDASVDDLAKNTPTIYSYDFSTESIQTTSSQIYVGARWDGGGGTFDTGYFLCSDDNRVLPDRPMYAKVSSGSSWVSFDDPILFGNTNEQFKPDAIGVRIDTSPIVVPCPQTPCVEDDDTLCLNGDRYAVDVAFDPPPPTDDDTLLEPGHAVELTDDTGYFWFFRDTNVEMVLKVLDGCGVNGHYWVFAGGLTNVQVEMKVCDTQEGIQRIYRNPQETTFQPIQDTAAFATCP